MTEIRHHPCAACPYRCDVASGVWAGEEYDKLTRYDAPTYAQPLASFSCHATPEKICHGWAVVHTSRGQEYDLLALRLVQRGNRLDIPVAAVPLFSSGEEAAAHGKRGLQNPCSAAKETMKRLERKHSRLRTERHQKLKAEAASLTAEAAKGETPC